MSKYDRIIAKVFFNHFQAGQTRVGFHREALAQACADLGFDRIKNLGDIPYSYRFRKELPDAIKNTAPSDSEWIIVGDGIALYEFRQAAPGKIKPSGNRMMLQYSNWQLQKKTMY